MDLRAVNWYKTHHHYSMSASEQESVELSASNFVKEFLLFGWLLTTSAAWRFARMPVLFIFWWCFHSNWRFTRHFQCCRTSTIISVCRSAPKTCFYARSVAGWTVTLLRNFRGALELHSSIIQSLSVLLLSLASNEVAPRSSGVVVRYTNMAGDMAQSTLKLS